MIGKCFSARIELEVNKTLIESLIDEFKMDLSDDFDDFASYYKNKLNRPRKSYGTSKRNKFNGVESQTEAVKKLNLLKIPKPAKAILTKLLLTGQLSSVDEILHRSNTAIVLRGKISLLVKKQKSLESENIVIKIFVNGTTEELQTKAKNEYGNYRIIMQIENIVIMSMIGGNEPAMTLQQVLRSRNYQKISTVYRNIIRRWIDSSCPKFDTTNILWHDDEWLFVGSRLMVEQHDEVESIKESLKKIVATFGHYGVSKKQAEHEILKYQNTFFYYYHRSIYLRDLLMRDDFEEIFFS
jgi:hypothetical protein